MRKLEEAEWPNSILLDVLKSVMKDIRSSSNCSSVGIRLKRKADYPYFVHEGFPEFFIVKEDSLLRRDSEGNVIQDSGGASIGDCMCSNVLREHFDPRFPFFTKKGSFWTNSTSQLLQTITDEQREFVGKTRDMCQMSGYESVALLPMQAEGRMLGLIQLNDPRENMFTLEEIERYEQISESVGALVLDVFRLWERISTIQAMVKN